MSYSRTLRWNIRYFKSHRIVSFSSISSFAKSHQPSEVPCRKLPVNLEPGRHVKPVVIAVKERYSFTFPRRPFELNSQHRWCRCNSNSGSNSNTGNNENGPLTKAQAGDLVLRLTEDERKNLYLALQEFISNQVKAEYEGQLAATRWRSKFGRPSKLPSLGDVDPTGSYCHLPEDWLKKKYAEKVPPPVGNQLIHIAIFNAVPFVGFGFLDNFIMICAGDYIDETLGSMITISTMAAAALGNTVSDVMGIGSAWYVELAATKIGLKPPNLSPIQLDMKSARRAANLGRALGIVVGCLLGMIPLLFFKDSGNNQEAK